MPTQMHKTQSLVEKIQSLPAERIAEVENFVDRLKQRTRTKQSIQDSKLNFPVISAGEWPNDLSLSREDMYSNDGR